jgi:hypothetical protein
VRSSGDVLYRLAPGLGNDFLHELSLHSHSTAKALAEGIPPELSDTSIQAILAPVGLMAGIPVEALTDQYTVSYTPSGTYLARLKDRAQPRSTRVLAVGDPLFPPAKDLPRPTELPPGGLLVTQVVPDGNAAASAGRAACSWASVATSCGAPLPFHLRAFLRQESRIIWLVNGHVNHFLGSVGDVSLLRGACKLKEFWLGRDALTLPLELVHETTAAASSDGA